MPLYEYQCQSCGHLLEVIQKFSDEPRSECPECKGKLEKMLSAPAIQFKGSGWYITDYSRKTGEKSGDGGKEPTTEKSKAAESKDTSPKKEPKASESKSS